MKINYPKWYILKIKYYICIYLNDKEMRNIKTITVVIPNELVLSKIKKTPTFNSILRGKLIVGENKENVNYSQFERAMRLFPISGALVIE